MEIPELDDVLNEVLGKEEAGKVKDQNHGEGLLTSGKQGYTSVLQRIAQAVKTDMEYRQALLLASFVDTEEADLATSALAECSRYGVPITPIVDRVLSHCAVKGAEGGRVQSIVEALTHQTLTANVPGGIKKAFEAKRERGPLSEA